MWGCVAALDVSNKAVFYSLTITGTNWLPQASINDPVRVVISFAYLPHHKPIPCKLKRATRTPFHLWDTIEYYPVNHTRTAFYSSQFANNIKPLVVYSQK